MSTCRPWKLRPKTKAIIPVVKRACYMGYKFYKTYKLIRFIKCIRFITRLEEGLLNNGDGVGGILVGACRHDCCEVMVEPIEVCIRVADFFIHYSACEPKEWLAVWVEVLLIFFGPVAFGGTHNFHAFYFNLSGEIDVEAHPFGQSLGEYAPRDMDDMRGAFCKVGFERMVEE